MPVTLLDVLFECYGNIGYQVSKEGIQNLIDVWPTYSEKNIEFCEYIDLSSSCQKVLKFDFQS